jgi:predicted phosphoribosyltransferase
MLGDRFTIFHDRYDAGRQLARALEPYAGWGNLLILALPRGGVPVGYEVARALHAPLDVYLVRKLGVPGRPELAMGAIASGGVRILNEGVIAALGISEAVIDAVTAAEMREIERRDQHYRDGCPPLAVPGMTCIVVDDGLATGATMRAALTALRMQGPARIIVAVPTAARETCNELEHEADAVVCLTTPAPFYAVGAWYADFSATEDDEVRALLARARQMPRGGVQARLNDSLCGAHRT